jgi:hypothetical protein
MYWRHARTCVLKHGNFKAFLPRNLANLGDISAKNPLKKSQPFSPLFVCGEVAKLPPKKTLGQLG